MDAGKQVREEEESGMQVQLKVQEMPGFLGKSKFQLEGSFISSWPQDQRTCAL